MDLIVSVSIFAGKCTEDLCRVGTACVVCTMKDKVYSVEVQNSYVKWPAVTSGL